MDARPSKFAFAQLQPFDAVELTFPVQFGQCGGLFPPLWNSRRLDGECRLRGSKPAFTRRWAQLSVVRTATDQLPDRDESAAHRRHDRRRARSDGGAGLAAGASYGDG